MNPFDAFLSRAVSDCVNAKFYPDKLHDGPCDEDGGYLAGGREALCSRCIEATKQGDRNRPGGGER